MMLLGLLFVVSCILIFLFIFTSSFLGNAVLKLHAHFHLVYCIFAVVIVCHFLCSLMACDCQKNKRITCLLAYLDIIQV